MTTRTNRHSPVLVETPSGRWAKEKKLLVRFLSDVLALVAPKASVDVFLVSSKQIHELNRAFLKRDRPTTVLSFEATDGFPSEGGGRALGEVYLAPTVIVARGMDLRELALHGSLHLLGYTHDGKRDTIEMERREKKILEELGF
jgi:probable rRNA maturation factor